MKNKKESTPGILPTTIRINTGSFMGKAEAEALESFHKAMEAQVWWGTPIFSETVYRSGYIDGTGTMTINGYIEKYGEEKTRKIFGDKYVDEHLKGQHVLKMEADLEDIRKTIYDND